MLGTWSKLPVTSRRNGGDGSVLRVATHVYNGGDNGMRRGDPEPILKARFSFGLHSATRGA